MSSALACASDVCTSVRSFCIARKQGVTSTCFFLHFEFDFFFYQHCLDQLEGFFFFSLKSFFSFTASLFRPLLDSNRELLVLPLRHACARLRSRHAAKPQPQYKRCQFRNVTSQSGRLLSPWCSVNLLPEQFSGVVSS